MTAPSVTYTFTNNTIADGSQVSTNFSDLVTYVSNRNDGSSTWDRLLVTSSSAVPLIVNNSTGTSNIANFQDNGTNVLTITNGGTTTITAVNGGSDKALVVNNGTSTGNILEAQDNGSAVFTVANGGNATFAGNLQADAGSESAPIFSFTGDANSGMYSAGADILGFAVGGTLRFQIGASTEIVSTLSILADSAASINIGSATNYVSDVSYKTLTDRGCLPFCDDGVELADGRVVSDCEALDAIKKHPKKKTVHGLPMLDYSTFPKKAYKLADRKGVTIARNEEGEPVEGADGIEMTMMFGVMIGAIKEINGRLRTLEAQ